MKKSIPHWQVAGFIFTCVLGTLLHFFFDFTGDGVVAALFSAVNESIWEHMKLLYYPMTVFALIEYRVWGKETENFWCVKLLGLLLGLGLIPVIYYTYTGILGIRIDWLNVAIFFIAAAAAFYMETKLFQKEFSCPFGGKVSFAVILLVGAAFIALTFLPPHIPFFRDPQTGGYGFF